MCDVDVDVISCVSACVSADDSIFFSCRRSSWYCVFTYVEQRRVLLRCADRGVHRRRPVHRRIHRRGEGTAL